MEQRPLFEIKWSVTEIVDGHGEHDDGVVHGQRTIVASGNVQKLANSESEIRDTLLALLKGGFPEQGCGPTYDIKRVYDIAIRRVQPT